MDLLHRVSSKSDIRPITVYIFTVSETNHIIYFLIEGEGDNQTKVKNIGINKEMWRKQNRISH